MEIRRIALQIEYNGSAYAGWQRQKNALSIQEVLENVLSCLCNEGISLTGASRTDAGVHARGQVAHFETTCSIPGDRFAYALNTLLPPDIRVLHSRDAAPDFHARFQAKGKVYSYRFLNAPHNSALLFPYVWHIPGTLDTDRMQKSLPALVGTHDFSSFMAAGNQSKTTVRTIYHTELQKEGQVLLFRIYGNGFLYNMVRIIAGSLVYIGLGKESPDLFSRAYESHSRILLGPTAPPQGLCLEKIYYETVPWEQTGYFEGEQ
ncbi:MAG: tRNA pseudouridine(38-40) synthase TruA [Clostridia bacterium]|nr:tRNA pseudouridine(38-40) synthase TruA [Clostridia bacterium]